MDAEFDICIIGSGIAGGLLASQLASTGKRIAIVEAGKKHDRAELQRRLANGGAEPFWLPTPAHLHVPITVDANFRWLFQQNKEVGGNSIFWGAWAGRPLEEEFRMKKVDGVGEDWPITYDDLEPFYGRAEEELGVSGAPGDAPTPPRSKPYPLPPFPHSYTGKRFVDACARLGFGAAPIPVARPSQAYRGRSVCCLAGMCSTCPTGAKYSSDINHIKDAVAHSNVTLLVETVASKLISDSHRVKSLLCHKPDRTTLTIKADIFIVACNAMESARLLQQSASKDAPNGLANASGEVGRHFMTHLFRGFGLLSAEPLQARGESSTYSRHFERGAHRSKHAPFRISVGASASPADVGSELVNKGYMGAELVRELRDSMAKRFGFGIEIGMLPSANNRVVLDHEHRDFLGNPGLKVTLNVSDYEDGVWPSVRAAVDQIAKEMNAKIDGDPDDVGPWTATAHQMGTHRMGTDRKTSVVNTNLRAHDVANLFLCSAGAFPNSLGPTNPTLTVAALALRLVDHLRNEVIH